MNKNPERSPCGWVVEWRTRKSGPRRGSRYKVTIEKSTVEDLPPGWIKELKITKKVNGIRKDPYYTDPVSGYVFRSKLDVLRYLETGDISRYAFLPKKRLIDGEISPSDAAKSQSLKHPPAGQQLLADQGKESSDVSSTEAEAEALRKRIDKMVSSLSVDPTTELTPLTCLSDSAVDNSSRAKKNYNTGLSEVPKAQFSIKDQGINVGSADGPVLMPASDQMEKQNSSKSGIRSSKRETQNHMGKSNDMKWLSLPRRSSKRLVGLEPKPITDSVSGLHVVQNVTRSWRNQANQAVGLTTDYLTGKTSPPFEAKSRTKTQRHAFSNANNLLLDKPSDKCQKSPDDQAVTKEQSQELETNKIKDEKSKPRLIPPHGELWTNQCPEYASKTPAVAIPVENDAFPAADIMTENNLLVSEVGKIDNKRNVKRSKSRRELNLPSRSSNLSRLEPELVVNSMSSKEAFETAARSCKGETSQQLKAEPRLELLNGFTEHNAPPHEKPSDNSQKLHHDQALLKEQSLELIKGKNKDEKSESGNISPLEVFYTDPGPEYSSETLAVAIPVENGSIPAANMMDENNLLESRMGIMDSEKNVKISNSRKEVNLPYQTSNQLARLEPVLVANSVSSKEAYENVARFCKNEASQQLEAEPRTEPLHGSADACDSSQGKPSTRSEKPNQDQAIPKGQSQELKTDKSLNEKSESDLIPPHKEFWTDVCPEISCKSLPGEIVVENNSIMYENNLLESRMGQTDDKKDVKNSKSRKELNLPRRSSKRLAKLQSELVVDSVSSKEAYEIVVRFCNREPAQQIEDETRTEPLHKLSDVHKARQGKPSINSQKPIRDPALHVEQSQEPETRRSVDEKSESDLIPTHGEFRKDPYPENSSKSLLVARPIENYLISAAGIMDENNQLVSRMGQTDNKKNVKRSKSRKELNLSCRSAQRLAQLEPELTADSVSSKEAYEIVVSICKSEASHWFVAEARTEFLNKSADANNSAQGKPSNNIQKPLLDQALPKEESQEMEIDKTIDEKSEPRLIPLFGEFLSDPCLEYTVKTLVRGMPVDNAAENGLVSSPAVDTMKKYLARNLKEKRSKKKIVNPGRSRNRKEPKLSRKSSKKLAGLESEIATNSVLSVQSLATSIDIQAMGLTSDGLSDEASQQLEPGAELLHQGSAYANYPFHGEPSSKRQKCLFVSREQLQELETDKMNVGKSEQQLIPPFSEFLSDPCLEFAFKTLTGAIPVENAADMGLVSTPNVDIVGGKSPLLNSRANNKNKDGQNNPRKSKRRKELKLACQSPRRLAGLELKPTTNSTSRRSSKTEAILDVDLALGSLADRPLRQLQLGPTAEHHNFKDVFTDVIPTLQEEPSNERDVPSGCTINEMPSQKLEVERLYGDKPEPEPFFSVEDYWSDPCLEFAIKTLTGAIPVEDSFVTPTYFQPPANPYQTQKEGYLQQKGDTAQRDDYFQPQNNNSHNRKDGSLSLPDYGLPSFFQTDISVHFDASEKQLASQPQMPLSNTSFLPSGSMSLQTCSSIGSQQPYFKGNKRLSGKVKS